MPYIRRRSVVAGLVTLGAAPAPARMDAWGFEFSGLETGRIRFAEYRGRVLLVANTASFCQFTPEYKDLEAANRALGPQGLTVIGIPSQDFGQESASDAKVKAFCTETYNVDFPMTTISHVHGAGAIPFYRWVKAERNWEPQWNFYKVLIGRNGEIAGVYGSKDLPGSGQLEADIAKALGSHA